MKTSLFLLLFVASHAVFAQHATIVLQADSSAGKTIFLKQFHSPGLDYDIVDSAKVANGFVTFLVHPDPVKEYELYSGRDYIADDIYLAGGDSLVFSYGPKHQSLTYDKMGANAMLRDSSNRPRSQSDFYRGMNKYSSGRNGWDPMTAFSNICIAKITKSADRIMTKYPEHTGIAAAMRASELRWYYEPRFRYYHKYYDTDNAIDPKDIERITVLDSVPWRELSSLPRPEVDYLSNDWMNLMGWYWRRSSHDSSMVDFEKRDFEFAMSLPSPARDVAVQWALSYLHYLKADTALRAAQEEYERYKNNAYDNGYKEKFQKMIGSIQEKLPGKPAPNFHLPDITGTMRSLEDFRGKTLYIDFWGTWCGPCIGELWDLKQLQKKFEGDPSVAFVSIGLEASDYEDQSFKGWKRFIADSALTGTQLYADRQFDNEFVEEYGIEAVPAFMIIGPDGNFIDSSAPRPSSGKAEEAIRSALGRKKE